MRTVLGGERRLKRRTGVREEDSSRPGPGGNDDLHDGNQAGDAAGIPPGEVVISTAGRDHGRAYVVVAAVEPPFVLVADGMTRRVGRPKRKNMRHLMRLPVGGVGSAAEMASAGGLPRGRPLNDERVRAILRQAMATSGEPGEGGQAAGKLVDATGGSRREGDA